MTQVEPPVQDELFDDTETTGIDGDWDRDFWYQHAKNVYNIDTDVLDHKPVEWIVQRCSEEPNRYYSS